MTQNKLIRIESRVAKSSLHVMINCVRTAGTLVRVASRPRMTHGVAAASNFIISFPHSGIKRGTNGRTLRTLSRLSLSGDKFPLLSPILSLIVESRRSRPRRVIGFLSKWSITDACSCDAAFRVLYGGEGGHGQVCMSMRFDRLCSPKKYHNHIILTQEKNLHEGG